MGDSLSAGYQNGSLLDRQQVHGYAALLAVQARVPLPLPLIAEPGIPNVLMLDPVACAPASICRAPGVSPGRLDPAVQAMNLAVPGAYVAYALRTRPDVPIDSLTDLVLGLPGLLPELFGVGPGLALSQVEWAETLAPTTIVVWIGNMDTLGAVIFGADASGVTPLADFERDYAELLGRLAATGATLVVGNIPDVTVIPYLTAAETVVAGVAEATSLPATVIEAALGIGPGDFVTPDGLPLIPAILANPALGPLPADVVLTAGEVATIREATGRFNAVIAAEAQAAGAALVDVHGLLNDIRDRGVVTGGRRLTSGFLGGLFSLDGVHPTNTGYAVLANEFIHALDRHVAAGIPPVSVDQVEADDPLVLPGVGHLLATPGHPSAAAAHALRAGLGRRR